jgi:3-deoxy-D-manno-octulosonic-acid transferase
MHAVSVGEVLAVSRLVAELDAEFTGIPGVISTTTRTGQSTGPGAIWAERVFLLSAGSAVGGWRRI